MINEGKEVVEKEERLAKNHPDSSFSYFHTWI